MSMYRDLGRQGHRIVEICINLDLIKERAERQEMPADVAKGLDDAISYLKAARALIQKAANATPETVTVAPALKTAAE